MMSRVAGQRFNRFHLFIRHCRETQKSAAYCEEPNSEGAIRLAGHPGKVAFRPVKARALLVNRESKK